MSQQDLSEWMPITILDLVLEESKPPVVIPVESPDTEFKIVPTLTVIDPGAAAMLMSVEATVIQARDDAQTAQQLAQEAQVFAETAQAHSETAQQLSEQAQALSEQARDSAIDARDASQQAQALAEEAQGRAETAQQAAELAQSLAEQAQSRAETAQSLSEDAAVASAVSAQQSGVHRSAAEDAQLAAETAQDLAENAQNHAETAQLAAENARDTAQNLRDAVATDRAAVQDLRDTTQDLHDQVAIDRGVVAQDRDTVATDKGIVADLKGQVDVALGEAQQAATDTAADRDAVASDRTAVAQHRSQVQGLHDDTADLRTETLGYRNEAENFKDLAESAAVAASSGLKPVGGWDASQGIDPPTPQIGEASPWYRITVAGTVPAVGAVEVGDNLYWSPASQDWFLIDNTDKIHSVNGKTGTVVLGKADVGLSQVDNTSDMAKPVSTAQQQALDGKVNTDDSRLSNAREWTATTVSQSEAETGTATTRRAWTSQRVRQAAMAAITSWWNGSSIKATFDSLKGMAFLDKASYAQAIAGESDSVGMTPLLDRQAMDAYTVRLTDGAVAVKKPGSEDRGNAFSIGNGNGTAGWFKVCQIDTTALPNADSTLSLAVVGRDIFFELDLHIKTGASGTSPNMPFFRMTKARTSTMPDIVRMVQSGNLFTLYVEYRSSWEEAVVFVKSASNRADLFSQHTIWFTGVREEPEGGIAPSIAGPITASSNPSLRVGEQSITADNINNWNTAYGWGDYRQFGIGVPDGQSPAEVADVDAAKTSGNFRLPANASGDHPFPGISSSLSIEKAASSFITQWATRGGSDSTFGNTRAKFRRFNGTDWLPWAEVLTSANLPNIQSATPANGGLLVDNQKTGTGLERVLTESDLDEGTGSLGQMAYLNKATQAQAEAGTRDDLGMTPLMTRRAAPNALRDPSVNATLVLADLPTGLTFNYAADGGFISETWGTILSLKTGGNRGFQFSIDHNTDKIAFRNQANDGLAWRNAVELWHTGNLPQSSIDNWNTAYGWGNHASAGYLTSVSWNDVGGKPATATRWPTFAEVTGKPSTYAPTIGTTSTTAKAGDWLPSWGDIQSKPAVIAAGATAAEARAAIGAGTSNLTLGTTSSTAAAGNDSRINNGQTAYEWGNFRDYGLGTGGLNLTELTAYTSNGFYRILAGVSGAPFAGALIVATFDGSPTKRALLIGSNGELATAYIFGDNAPVWTEQAPKPSRVSVPSSRGMSKSDDGMILFTANGMGSYTVNQNIRTGATIGICTSLTNTNLTVTPGSGFSLVWMKGGSSQTGARTVAPKSTVTLIQQNSDTWVITGNGIS